MKSRFASSLLLLLSIASLVALPLASASHHHSAKHHKNKIRFPWFSSPTPTPNPPAPTTPAPPPTPPSIPSTSIKNLISIGEHHSSKAKKHTPEEIERARIESLKRSPYKEEPPAFPATGLDVEEFLNMHNVKRTRHGLKALEWDPALAKVAAEALPYNRPVCGLVHSPEKIRTNISGKHEYSYAGENLMAHYGGGPTTISVAVQSWINEEQCYKFGPVSKAGTTYKGPNCNMIKAQSGHYTQLMSDYATHVGCAHFYCGKKQFLQKEVEGKPPNWFTGLGYVYACEYGNSRGGSPGNGKGVVPFPARVARSVGLPFVDEAGGRPPPLDDTTQRVADLMKDKRSSAAPSGLQGEMSKYFKQVRDANGNLKVVAKTPEEIKADEKKNKGKGKGKKKKKLLLASLQSEQQLRQADDDDGLDDDTDVDADADDDTSLLQKSSRPKSLVETAESLMSSETVSDDDSVDDSLDDNDKPLDDTKDSIDDVGKALFFPNNSTTSSNNDDDDDTALILAQK